MSAKPNPTYSENLYPSLEHASADPSQVHLNANNASTTSGQPIPYPVAYIQPPSNNQMWGTIQANEPNIDGIRDYMPWSIINICIGGLLLGMIAVLLSYITIKRKQKRNIQSAKRWSRITLIFNVFADFVAIAIVIAIIVVYITKYRNVYRY